MLLLIIKVILGDRIVEPIFNILGPMQSKPVDLVAYIDERKKVTNVQLIRGISKETPSVTFELMKMLSFSKCFSGCFRLEAIFIKNSLK